MSLELQVEMEHLGLEESDLEGLQNPLKDLGDDPALAVLRVMRNPDYFYFTCKYLFGIELYPYQCAILKEMWLRKFPMLVGTRGLGKSFILGIFAMLYAVLVPGSKVVVTGAGFRQAKQVFNVCENIWHSSPVLRSLFGGGTRKNGPSHDADCWTLRLGDSTIKALPIGDGSKIRGERANVVIVDEFASGSRAIFETVIGGFAAVNLEPVKESKRLAKIRVLRKMGVLPKDGVAIESLGNITILSGTAYYQFNHFAEYWRKWKAFIESKGDKKKLLAATNGKPNKDLDWRNYAIIRIPYNLLPEGQMDRATIARQRATIHTGSFQNEYGAVFSADSKGFYRRSLLEACTTTNPVVPKVEGGEPVQFRAAIRGNPSCSYIMGVDPASEEDNFSIVILELHNTHRRIVHCWTTNSKQYQERVNSGESGSTDYYGHCARKIRELMETFPVEAIALDAQGGGLKGVLEALHDPAKMKPGEIVLLENTRFYPEEKSGDSNYAKELAKLAEAYVNDAFAASHRSHASRSQKTLVSA